MNDDPALIIATERNDTATVRQLLKAGANLHARDAQGRTGLLAATAHNHVEIAKLLIEAGADVNARIIRSTARCFWPALLGIWRF